MIRKRMETTRIIYFIVCAAVIFVGLCRHVSRKKRKLGDGCQDNVELQSADNKKGKEELQFTLESVNSWLNNCDQKAGILLAVVGVAITVLVTSDFLKELRTNIFIPFVKYWTEETELTFSWSRFTVFVLLVIALAMLVTTCYYLFRATRANIDYDKMYEENPGLVKNSYIYWGTISGMTYEYFKQDDVNYEDDLKSQIYVNSKIAMAKFQNYNMGLYWFKFMLWVSIMLFIAVMFMK